MSKSNCDSRWNDAIAPARSALKNPSAGPFTLATASPQIRAHVREVDGNTAEGVSRNVDHLRLYHKIDLVAVRNLDVHAGGWRFNDILRDRLEQRDLGLCQDWIRRRSVAAHIWSIQAVGDDFAPVASSSVCSEPAWSWWQCVTTMVSTCLRRHADARECLKDRRAVRCEPCVDQCRAVVFNDGVDPDESIAIESVDAVGDALPSDGHG